MEIISFFIVAVILIIQRVKTEQVLFYQEPVFIPP